MSMHRHAAIDETVYFYFAANDTSGSGADGATPLARVRLGGAAAGAAPVHSPAAALLTEATYPDGCHEVAVVCSAANGFAAGSSYGVFCTLAVDGQNPTGFIGGITLAPVASDLQEIGGESAPVGNLQADYDGTGYSKANSAIGSVSLALALSGHTAQTGDSYPQVQDIQSRLPAALSGGRMASDAQALAGDTDAATNLQQGALQLEPFVVGASPSATSIPTNITGAPYTNTDHFKNRVVTINKETKPILGSSGSPVVLTVADFASVPSQNDLGVIS